VLAVVGPALPAVAGYGLWTAAAGITSRQASFVREARTAGAGGLATEIGRLAIVGLFVVGLFVAPLAFGALRGLPAVWRRAGYSGRALAVGGGAGLLLWAGAFARTHDGYTFPFIPVGSMIEQNGLGVLFGYGDRPALFSARWPWAVLAVLCALACATAVLLLAAGTRTVGGRQAVAGVPGLVAALGAGQFVGMIPASLVFREWITFDRYYLPLLPFALGLVLWALRERRFAPGLALAVLLALGVVDVLGTQDWFAFRQTQWQAADWLLTVQEVPLRQLDVSTEWDGLHLYEEALAHPEEQAPRHPGDPEWLSEVTPMVDPAYIVQIGTPDRPGYRLLARWRVDSWIRRGDGAWVYALARQPSSG
jgi:hypothetical protein